MSNVFISYSRHDQAFVHRLYDALKAADREAWVDWEGIPPTAEWLKEIYGAIESADAFVFVLSPDSLASETCGREVAHAIDNKKRSIPLVCRDVSAAEVRANERLRPVADVNWIMFREEDGFQEAFRHLLDALDTDLGYVQQATRFLVRAKQWEASGRSPSLALRGVELSQAEAWLAEGADKHPSPTALQVQYITGSRKVTNRTQRIVISALSVGLLVTLGLSVFSFVQTRYAQAQQQQAELAARVATARQLTALARTALLQNQVDAALLYSLKALQVHADDNTRTSLFNALAYSPSLETTLPATDDAADSHRIAMSRDGQTIALVEAHQIVVWHRDTAKSLSLFLTPNQREQKGPGGEGVALALSPHGNLLVLATFKGVWLWDATTGAALGQLPGQTVVAHQESAPVVFSADGHWLVTQQLVCHANVVSCDAYEVLWDVRSTTPQPTLRFRVPTGAVSSASISADDRWLAASGWLALDPGQDGFFGSGQLLLFDMQTGELRTTYTGMGPIWSIAFTAHNQLISGGCGDPYCTQSQLLSWDASGGMLGARELIGPTTGLNAVAASADGNVVVSAGSELLLWRRGMQIGGPLTYRSTALLGRQSGYEDAILSADGTWLLSRDGQDTALWNTSPHHFGTRSLEGTLLDGGSDVFAFSGDGELVAGTFGDGLTGPATDIWNVETGALLTTFYEPSLLPREFAFSQDRKTLAMWADLPTDESAIQLRDTATGQLVGTPVKLPGDTAGVAFSPDLHRVATTDGSLWITVYDMATGQQVRSIKTPDKVSGIAFNHDGRTLASYGEGKLVYLWDVQTGALIGSPLGGFVDAVASGAFSPDGALIAARDSHSIRIWDVKTHALRATLPNAGSDGPLALSPDNRYLAYSRQNLITVWNLATRQPLAPPFQAGTAGDTVTDLRFSPDGRILASDGGGGLLLWDPNFDSWRARACRIANRNFTAAEWEQFDDIHNYTTICPDLPVHPSVIEAWLSLAEASTSSGHTKDAASEYAQATRWAVASRDDTILDEVCWRGSVGGFASVVIAACNAASSLLPQDGDYRDSRGLARALTGDKAGAIADFEAFFAWANTYAHVPDDYDAQKALQREAAERQQWITSLRAGSNPFTPKLLNTIRDEKYP